jgi:hypothetical protein
MQRSGPFRAAGLLHTIIFNRALGPVQPVEVESEQLDLSYVRQPFMPSFTLSTYQAAGSSCACLQVRVHDAAVVAAVESSISDLCRDLERSAGQTSEAQVCR